MAAIIRQPQMFSLPQDRNKLLNWEPTFGDKYLYTDSQKIDNSSSRQIQ